MKTHLIILFLISLFTTLSCNKKNEYQHETSINNDSFIAMKSLTGSTVEFDNILMKPSQLQIYDTLLITYNQGTEKFFHIFNLKSKKKVGECISMGQGPTEMIMPWFVQNKEAVTIFDMGTSLVSKFTIEEFSTNPNPNPFQQIKLDAQVFSEVSLLGDEFIGSLYRPESPLYLFNNKGEKVKEFGAYPISKITYTDVEIIDAYRSIITTNKKDKVAVCHFWSDLIDIYDKNGNLENRLHGPEHFFPHFKEYIEGNIITTQPVKGKYKDAFYSPISVGDEFFVLYNGKSLEEAGYNLLAKQIFVFSWNGIPKKRYLLDQGVSRIAVDDINKKIYGISDDPEYHIIEFSYD